MKDSLPGIFSEDLMALFSNSTGPATALQKIKGRVQTMICNFMATESVSTEMGSALLAAPFQQSACLEQAMSFESYLDFLEEKVIPHSVNMASPRCLGHMTSIVPSFLWTLGELVLALNQNMVKREASKTFTLLERQTIALLHRLTYRFSEAFYDEHVQKDTSTLGILVSGGTLANITALWIARNSCFGPTADFAGIEEEGVAAALKYYDYDGAVIIGSSLMHYSFEKAASTLGFGARSLIKLPVDRRGNVCLHELRKTVAECAAHRQRIIALIGVAGATDCGSIDPLAEIAEIAEEWNIHFHVDAAWGGPLLFSQRHRKRLAGIERASSVTFDGHKQLYLPVGNSMLLLREPHAAKVIEKQTRYMLQEHSGDLGKWSFEGSRPGTVLFWHAALHVIGSDGYEFIIEENVRKAQLMARLIAERPEFELLVEPQTNILLYRYVPESLRRAAAQGTLTDADNELINECNEEIQRAQSRAGRALVSRTILNPKQRPVGAPLVALRAVIGNPFTGEEDMKMVLDDQVRVALELTRPTVKASSGEWTRQGPRAE